MEFDKHKHTSVVMIEILRDIYNNTTLRSAIGFKGGTALYLLYDLPRTSVDLDFEIINGEINDSIKQAIVKIAGTHGEIKSIDDKRYTYLVLIVYEKYQKNLKIEISKRQTPNKFEVKNYLGAPILVATKETLLSTKLSAYLTRSKHAARDTFDLWYMLKNKFELNDELIQFWTNQSTISALQQAITKTEELNRKTMLAGLGELVDEKQKAFIKEQLKEELLFQLNLKLKEKMA
ncbi:MAG: nucleotidyl transferase AbiEii/AbiGii toxin family protein [bacterium]|nr:nucleotidyl transferase AbiEii/AbiGii toxin family protein [bacterium]